MQLYWMKDWLSQFDSDMQEGEPWLVWLQIRGNGFELLRLREQINGPLEKIWIEALSKCRGVRTLDSP